MTGPHILSGVHAKTLPAPLRTMGRQRTAAAQLILPHALEFDPVRRQNLLDANVLLEPAEIHPATQTASLPLARISNGLPLLSTAIRYATSFRATASVALLRSPRWSSRSCTTANGELRRGASLAASISTVCRCLLRCLKSARVVLSRPNCAARWSARNNWPPAQSKEAGPPLRLPEPNSTP